MGSSSKVLNKPPTPYGSLFSLDDKGLYNKPVNTFSASLEDQGMY